MKIMEKLNIAELLRDCPKGMELNCTTWENVTFEKVVNDSIYIKRNNKVPSFEKTVVLNKYGCCTNYEDEKCRIFPKDKNTWEGFQKPFKNGDIVTWEDRGSLIAFIYKERKNVAVVKYHFALYTGSLGTFTNGEIALVESELVFATEEEKQKLFDAIKANGYRWNAETKTLERVIEPKFTIGDTIKSKNDKWQAKRTIQTYVAGIGYFTTINDWVRIDDQDEWELVPNKFNINTLKPFDKVLVRDHNNECWMTGIYSHQNINIFIASGHWKQCIPYKGNEHLLGTTNDCNDFYKTWE